jgi:hypothetical protein
VGNTVPPRDPNDGDGDDEEEDNDTEPDNERQPPVVREPAGSSADESKAIMKNPWTRDQLRPIFRSKADFNGFVDAVTAEQQMFRANVATRGGSQSAERVATDKQNAELGMRVAETGCASLQWALDCCGGATSAFGLIQSSPRNWPSCCFRSGPI